MLSSLDVLKQCGYLSVLPILLPAILLILVSLLSHYTCLLHGLMLLLSYNKSLLLNQVL
jgi:hypothetical protein